MITTQAQSHTAPAPAKPARPQGGRKAATLLTALDDLAEFCQEAQTDEMIASYTLFVSPETMEAIWQARRAKCYRAILENYCDLTIDETDEGQLISLAWVAKDGNGRYRGRIKFQDVSTLAVGAAA